jgi:predicted nucleic acid-binding protein
MNVVFADTAYWIALLDRSDNLHEAAAAASIKLIPFIVATTDEVFAEFLTFFAGQGSHMRRAAIKMIRDALADKNTLVVPQSRQTFLRGLKFYEDRLNSSYSLTDCISMIAMKELGIDQVLTHDKHFGQEGFVTLL